MSWSRWLKRWSDVLLSTNLTKMKILLTAPAVCFLLITGCKKSVQHYDRFEKRDTINNITVLQFDPLGTSGLSGISYIDFNLASPIRGWWIEQYSTKTTRYSEGCCYATLNSHTVVDLNKYYLKYVGNAPLIRADSIQYDDGYTANYMVTASLLGSAVFEAHDVTNDSLLQTIYFGDSASVSVIYNTQRKDSNGKEYLPPPIYLSHDSLTRALLYNLSPENFANSKLYAIAYPAQKS